MRMRMYDGCIVYNVLNSLLCLVTLTMLLLRSINKNNFILDLSFENSTSKDLDF